MVHGSIRHYSCCWALSSTLATHVDERELASGNRSLRSVTGRNVIRKESAMKWITRERAKVDRIACPWLISRFIDSQPEFLYVPADQVLAEAATQEAIPYDIPNVELGHKGPLCSFDALMDKYELLGHDPALDRVALIVRGADTADKDLTPESRGLDAIAGGFQQMGISDHEKLEKEFPVYDALYVYCGGTLPIRPPYRGGR